MIKKLKIWWKWHGRYIISDTKYGIKNIIKWLPIIWRDRDWDQKYIWDIMRFKLKNQGEHFLDYGHFVDSEADAKRMLLCVKLIERVSEGVYESEYLNYFSDEHWFTDSSACEGCKELNSKEEWENFDDFFKKYPLIYKRVVNGAGPFELDDKTDKRRIAMNVAYINHDRAKKLLFKVMEENIEMWWS